MSPAAPRGREGSTCMTATASHQPSREEIEAWAHELEALYARFAPRFERSEPRRLVYRLMVRTLAPPEAVLHWSPGVVFTRPVPGAATTADALGMCSCRNKKPSDQS